MPVVFLVVISLIMISCKKEKPSSYENFYYQILSLIEQKSIRKNEINWSDIKKDVKDSIIVFNNMEDVYKAVRFTLKLINDGHSKLLTAQLDSCGNQIQFKVDSIALIETRIIDGDIAYINLHGISANGRVNDIYAMEIRKSLLSLDSSTKLSGWIIDIRSNPGGYIPSESLGLSPLFEQPLIGIMCDNSHSFKNVICTKSVFSNGDIKVDSLICDSILNNRQTKIAVLVGKSTASAAEFLASAFRFQKNTKIFGSKTQGATSLLDAIVIRNSADLIVAKVSLATEYYCDKKKNILRGGIIPDIECDSMKCITMAVDWIKQQ